MHLQQELSPGRGGERRLGGEPALREAGLVVGEAGRRAEGSCVDSTIRPWERPASAAKSCFIGVLVQPKKAEGSKKVGRVPAAVSPCTVSVISSA